MIYEGTLISAAKWLIKTESLSEEQREERITVDWHPDEDSNEWAEYLINWIHQHQISRTKGDPCVSSFSPHLPSILSHFQYSPPLTQT